MGTHKKLPKGNPVQLGLLVRTPGVGALLEQGEDFAALLWCIGRHARGDWGEVCPEDAAANDAALRDGDRLISAYTIAGTKVWIITEWDRSVTTVLLPDEY